MLHIAICEDDPVHLQILKNTLQENLLEMNLAWSAREYTDGKKFLEELVSSHAAHVSSAVPLSSAKDSSISPADSDTDNRLSSADSDFDLVFMDIELEKDDMSGITIAETINRTMPHAQIIFVSQYLAYAPDVYQAQHVYYVYKGRLQELLPKALKAALERLKKEQKQVLSFQSGTSIYRIPVSDIWYLERLLRQTIIYTRTGKLYTSEKLPQLTERLPDTFISCHRSYVINLAAVSSFERTSITFPDGSNIPLARSRIQPVRSAYARMLQQNQ